MESSTEAFGFLTNFRRVRLTTQESFVLEQKPEKLKNLCRTEKKNSTKLLRKNKNMLKDWDCKIYIYTHFYNPDSLICAYSVASDYFQYYEISSSIQIPK